MVGSGRGGITGVGGALRWLKVDHLNDIIYSTGKPKGFIKNPLAYWLEIFMYSLFAACYGWIFIHIAMIP